MATFAKSNFGFASYAAFRPSYPPSLYSTVLAYHRGPRNHAIDLGCGHGVVARSISPSFKSVKGIDPSEGMLVKARSLSTDSTQNITYQTGGATELNVPDHSVDLVFAGQAAHWFPYPAAFTALHKALRPGGTLAFFGYKDPVLPHHPRASEILNDYAYAEDKLGPYWTQPGRSIVQGKLRAVVPPEASSDDGGKESLWEDVTRIEYEPGTKGPESGEGTLFMAKVMTPAHLADYTRTWSSYHGWMEAHPDRKPRSEAGPDAEGDIVDVMMDELLAVEKTWGEPDAQVLLEWGSGLLMARAKEL